MAVLEFEETWPGANGDAWPSSRWEYIEESTNSDIRQSGVGTGYIDADALHRGSRAIAVSAPTTPLSIADVELDQTFTVAADTGKDAYFGFTIRGQGTTWAVAISGESGGNSTMPADGYVFRVSGDGDLVLRRLVDAVSTNLLGTTDVGSLAGKTMRLRFQAEGTTLRYKLWEPSAGGEPGTWDNSVTDSTHGAGNVRLAAGLSNDGQTLDIRYDDVLVYDLAASAGTALSRTIRSTVTGSLG